MDKICKVKRYANGYGWVGGNVTNNCIIAVYLGQPTAIPYSELTAIGEWSFNRNQAIYHFDHNKGSEPELETIKELGKVLKVEVVVE